MDLRKVATVFDRVADYVEAVEREKRASRDTAQQGLIARVTTAHVTAHGEDIPDLVRAKLASTDPEVLSYLETLFTKQAGSPEPLGGPAPSEDGAPSTIKQAADAADARFVKWLIS